MCKPIWIPLFQKSETVIFFSRKWHMILSPCLNDEKKTKKERYLIHECTPDTIEKRISAKNWQMDTILQEIIFKKTSQKIRKFPKTWVKKSTRKYMSVHIFQQSAKIPLYGPYRVDPSHLSSSSNLTLLNVNVLRVTSSLDWVRNAIAKLLLFHSPAVKSFEKTIDEDFNLICIYSQTITNDLEKEYVFPVGPHNPQKRTYYFIQWYIPTRL